MYDDDISRWETDGGAIYDNVQYDTFYSDNTLHDDEPVWDETLHRYLYRSER
jgi:hypothetical protein